MSAMNYNDGKWHGWNGGDCPVHPETVVELIVKKHSPMQDAAGRWFWDEERTRIVAFRVINEYKEQREFWIVGGAAFDSFESATLDSRQGEKIIHVREVTE